MLYSYNQNNKNILMMCEFKRIITDTYINIHSKYHNETLKNLIGRIKNKDQELELHNCIYK